MSNDLQRLKQRVLDAASTWGLAIIIVVAGFAFAYQFVEPAPPQRIVLATGQDGGAYQYYGEQFAAYLAAQGIETELRKTAGSVENLELLENGAGVDLGFVQGGLADTLPTENVIALGSLYLEPMWMFLRADVEISTLADFAGKRIAVGAEGSGTRAVVLNILTAHGIDAQTATFLNASSAELADAFAANAIDAAFLVGGPDWQGVSQKRGVGLIERIGRVPMVLNQDLEIESVDFLHLDELDRLVGRAVELAEAQLEVNANKWETQGFLGLYYAYLGDHDTAKNHIDSMFSLNATRDPLTHYWAGIVAVKRGDIETAFEEVEQALARGFGEQPHFITAEPALAVLSESNPTRFNDLIEKYRQ